MTCWIPLGRFVYRISVGMSPGTNLIRSGVSSLRHALTSGPWAASSVAPAASSAAHRSVRQRFRSPAPQNRVEYAPRTGWPSCVRRSLST